MAKQYFVTGTDTNVGKTLVSAILTQALQANYWKPIQSGIADSMSDMDLVRSLTNLSNTHFHPSTYSLQASLSPDQAAHLENVKIDLTECVMPKTFNTLIIEGAGGVFVPLNEQEFMFDLMKKFNVPIVVVSRGTLGTLNHTLLTIEALRNRGLGVHGIVFSGDLNKDNQSALEKYGKVRTLLHVPYLKQIDADTMQQTVKQYQDVIIENFS